MRYTVIDARPYAGVCTYRALPDAPCAERDAAADAWVKEPDGSTSSAVEADVTAAVLISRSVA